MTDADEVEITALSIWDGNDTNTSLLAEMHLRFVDFEPPSSPGNTTATDFLLLSELENEIQFLANARFGKDVVKFECVRIVRGSLVILATLSTVGGAAYLFFKDYPKLREGMLTFIQDVKTISRELRKIVKKHLKPRGAPTGRDSGQRRKNAR